jgi:hypothetical protein
MIGSRQPLHAADEPSRLAAAEATLGPADSGAPR